MTVQNILNVLSMEKVLAGLTNMKIQGNKETDNHTDMGSTGLEGFLTQVL